MRFLDPSGVLLESSTPEVRYYLRLRNDTLKVIVSAFTDETSPLNSLFEELTKYLIALLDLFAVLTLLLFSSDNATVHIDNIDDDEDSEEDDDESYMKWNPKPVAAQPDGMSGMMRTHQTKELMLYLLK